MGWEIYTKQARVVSASPKLTIGKRLGRCGLNRAAAVLFDKEGVDYVLLMWDKEGRRIGLRSSNKKDPRAFAVRTARKRDKDSTITGAAFSGITFLRHIGYDLSTSHSYPITWNTEDAVFEVQLSEGDLEQSQQPLVAVEGGKKHAKAGR